MLTRCQIETAIDEAMAIAQAEADELNDIAGKDVAQSRAMPFLEEAIRRTTGGDLEGGYALLCFASGKLTDAARARCHWLPASDRVRREDAHARAHALV